MLDQEKTGKYIAEKRKQLGMTQKELAERIGLTDKAVSKWERGKSIPDSMILEKLCGILQISLNEFLSGEDIEEECYLDKAEENMKIMINESNSQKRKRNTVAVAAGTVISVLFILLGMYAMLLDTKGIFWLSGLASFVDLPSLLFLIGIVLIHLIVSGSAADFFRIFVICIRKNAVSGEQIQKTYRAAKLVFVSNILAGAFITAGQIIVILFEVQRVLPFEFLALWYGMFFDLILLPFLFKLQNKQGG